MILDLQLIDTKDVPIWEDHLLFLCFVVFIVEIFTFWSDLFDGI